MAKNDKPAAKAKASGGQGTPSGTVSAGAQKSSGAKPSTTSTPGLAVTSTRDGYRRAGLVWTKAAIFIACADLTQEQHNRLIDDPLLTVEFVDRRDA